jgi:hypothetical protein
MERFRLLNRVHRLIATTRCQKRAPLLCFTRRSSNLCVLSLIAVSSFSWALPGLADDRGERVQKWVASWASSMQGAFVLTPTGSSAYFNNIFNLYYNIQPDLSFAFPNGTTDGAVDQTFRLIVKPDLWGRWIRLRFSNFFGTQPVTFSRVTVGLQSYAGNLVSGTNTPVTFGGHSSVTVPQGKIVFSDAVELRFARSEDLDKGDPAAVESQLLDGRNLAVSFAIQGNSGPMSYHAGAMTTSYVTAPWLLGSLLQYQAPGLEGDLMAALER